MTTFFFNTVERGIVYDIYSEGVFQGHASREDTEGIHTSSIGVVFKKPTTREGLMLGNSSSSSGRSWGTQDKKSILAENHFFSQATSYVSSLGGEMMKHSFGLETKQYHSIGLNSRSLDGDAIRKGADTTGGNEGISSLVVNEHTGIALPRTSSK